MPGPTLVTGGTGRLGAPLVDRLRASGADVRYTSRVARPGDPARHAVDLVDGTGLDAALVGVHTVLHCASSPFRATRATDVAGTERLVTACARAGVAHLVYISIVGVDRMPVAYYRAKFDAEAVVAAGPVPWSILRATQFHEFVAEILGKVAWSPIMPLATARIQPVDVDVVIDQLVTAAHHGPAGRLPDLGGPEVFALTDLARSWLAATGRRRLVLRLPVVGSAAHALADGVLCCAPGPGRGWAEWLAR